VKAVKASSRNEAFQVIKALADETRFEIYCKLQDSPTPLSVQEIAAKMGLHPNTVRPHLDRLKDSGLVAIESELSGKVGRPLHLYSVTPKLPGALIGDRALRILRGVIGDTLGELISEFRTRPEEAYELGRMWGRQIRSSAGTPDHGEREPQKGRVSSGKARDSRATKIGDGRRSIAVLSEDLELLGFEPTVEKIDDDTVVLFGDCPYRDLAQAAPEIVCTVHRAVCDESLKCAGEGVEVKEFHSIESGEPCQAHLGHPSKITKVSSQEPGRAK
jgi:predicted ArsR family transcriptional regulator